MITFELRPLRSCLEEAIAFRNTDRAVPRDKSYYDWRFGREGNPESLVAWLRDAHGESLACAALAPQRALINGAETTIALLGDITVDAAARGKGLGTLLLSNVKRSAGDAGYHGILVLPNAQAIGPLVKSGWRSITSLVRAVAPVRPCTLLRQKASRRIPASSAAHTLDSALLKIASVFGPGNGYNVQTTFSAGSGYRALFRRCTSTTDSFAAIRDEKFLRWRFQEHPYLRPEIVEVWVRGGLEGYAIYARSDNALQVLDHLAATPFAAAALRRELIEAARKDESILAIDTCNSSAQVGASPWAGPMFLNRGSAQVVMYASTESSEPPRLPVAWHFTRADKDV